MSSNKKLNLLNIALKIAHPSNFNGEYLRHHHGAIAVMSGKIVSQGNNSSRNYSHDGFIHHCNACHAEIDALRNLWKLAGKKGKKSKEQECLLRGLL
jgi:deoxycytidylate deaminase